MKPFEPVIDKTKPSRFNPGDPDLPELMERVNRSRECYLRWGRDCLGWAAYLFRKPS
ncbi:MAG TPA: hypothetical protein PLZ49_09975 [Bacillota bacterium]|nr:hypothetical protein [Bacillota bacterium]